MESQRPVVLGLSGSLREQSSNTRLLSFIGDLMPAGTEFRMYRGLAHLPHFSPDLDGDGAPTDPAVGEWRKALQTADAIVICTPEYAKGVPGTLKNALDWSVSSGEFVNKPTAAVSASPHPDGGATALHSLVLTLRMMSAVIPDQTSLALPFVTRVMAADGRVTDAEALSSLQNLVQALLQAIPERD